MTVGIYSWQCLMSSRFSGHTKQCRLLSITFPLTTMRPCVAFNCRPITVTATGSMFWWKLVMFRTSSELNLYHLHKKKLERFSKQLTARGNAICQA